MTDTNFDRTVAGTATPKLHEVMRQLASSSGTIQNYSRQQIGEAIYERAPRDFITQTEIARLTHIAEQAHDFLEEFLKSGKNSLLKFIPMVDRGEGRNKATGILSAFTDRSFIVDTVGCCLDSLGIRRHLFLHPILRFPDRSPVSLAYIETDHVSDPAQYAELQKRLESAYHDLFFVTEEYSPMVAELTQLIESFPNKQTKTNGGQHEVAELPEFLRWLCDGAFVFLGVRHSKIGKPLEHTKEFGIFRKDSVCDAYQGLGKILEEELSAVQKSSEGFLVSKIPLRGVIHRRAFLDVITVKVPEKNEAISIVGVFASRANKLECSSVPMLRKVLQDILANENLIPGSHAYKELIQAVDNMPRAELLSEPADLLRSDIRMITEASGKPQTRVRVSQDKFKRFRSALVLLPKQRMGAFAQDVVVSELEMTFGCEPGSAETTVGSPDLPLAMLHVLLPAPQKSPEDFSFLEARIAEGTITWEEDFRSQIVEGNDLSQLPERARLAAFYNKAFPEDYKALSNPSEAILDVGFLEKLSVEHPLEVDLRDSGGDEHILKIFRVGNNHTISSIFPYLEDTGLQITHEHVVELNGRTGLKIGIYRFELEKTSGLFTDSLKKCFLRGFSEILLGKAENDDYNRLLIWPGLTVEQIAVLRLYARYMKQIRAGTSADVISQAITSYPTLTKSFVEAFEIKFDPARYGETKRSERDAALLAQKEVFFTELKRVTQLTWDRALRLLWTIFEASVRTNFYSRPDNSRLAVKLKPETIPGLPLPYPFAEICVSAIDFEGVHLRGGRVARGGIRWSDRIDDYRTEVLGLMKTQMLKNSIIIPTGAKGGFVLKHRPQDPKELNAAVKTCYTRYVRSLLEVTDNRKNGVVIHPQNCVVYDGEDPYFVVAADRGTAMMSDTANKLSVEEFDLWIGDAFASGGSNGYDHKKLAITSRGTWETTLRHFREMGLDPETTDFTVVGIGDMSGDVFGNGLLRSRHTKLLAAFNHKHIFLDPNPNPEASFVERQRLFDLPGSQWSDYNPALISKGGGVFERVSKEIPLSEEIQKALGISVAALSGQELVRAILCAPVDLLWTGGIGTYVKSSTEDHLAAGDRANDEVRIDASELRARVVAEGGNLGFTQLARIEYAKLGGRINTDAIDNSGGVNMSDLEVNIKILLAAPLADGKLTLEQRNELLSSLADDVGEKVLFRNYTQSQTISLGVKRSERYLGYYRGLLDGLEKEKLLNRRSEFIPPDSELLTRIQQRRGLYRPELAIIIGYAKMSLTELILDSKLPDDPFCERYLLQYFPDSLVERFRDYVLKHPLKREIIATEIANAVVDRMGSVFVSRTANETGSSQIRVIEAFVAADAIFRGPELCEALGVLDRPEKTRIYLQLLVRMAAAIDSVTVWLLDQRVKVRTLGETVERYRDKFHTLVSNINNILSDKDQLPYREAWQQYVIQGLMRNLAQELPTLGFSGALMEIAELSINSKLSVVDLGRLYFHLAAELDAARILDKAKEIRSGDPWESSSARILSKEVLHCVGRMTTSFVETERTTDVKKIPEFLQARHETMSRYRSMLQEFLARESSISGVLVLTNQLYAVSHHN